MNALVFMSVSLNIALIYLVVLLLGKISSMKKAMSDASKLLSQFNKPEKKPSPKKDQPAGNDKKGKFRWKYYESVSHSVPGGQDGQNQG